MTAPLGLGLAFLFLPSLYGQIMGGVGAFDAQLRVDDDYMKTLCVEALDVDRDEQLCSCATAAEFPSLDCQIQFSMWRTLEHARRCKDDKIAQASVGFCACVTTLAERIESADEPRQARVAGRSSPRVPSWKTRNLARRSPHSRADLDVGSPDPTVGPSATPSGGV